MAAANQAQPYQYGLTTNFGFSNPSGMTTNREYNTPYTPFQNQNLEQGNYSGDPDVQAAAGLSREMQNARQGQDQGVDFSADQAALNMYTARINQKNSLGQAINANPSQMGSAQENLRQQSNQSLGQGINSTRSNYNSRGLLYSGLREGGEAQIKNAVSGNLASAEAGTTADYQNSMAAEKTAYGSVDLASAAQNIQMATDAYNTASQNNIARLQAMQQLGTGVGKAAGTVAGGYANPAPTGGQWYGGGTPTWSQGALGSYNFPVDQSLGTF